MKREFFEEINIRVPQERIYSRLGYTKGKTELSEADYARFDFYLSFALGKINLKGAAAFLRIKHIEEKKIYLEGDFGIIESGSLANFLKDCREALFLGATAGDGIMRVISQKSNKEGLERAVVADAVASETVDAALSWLIDYKARGLLRQNKALTEQRFSAGYGDFSLEYQKVLYDILQLKKIGVKLRKSYMLEPEKSVTAVCGVRRVPG